MWTLIKAHWVRVVLVLVSLGVLVRTGDILQVMVPDSWTHVGVGRFILENQRIPSHADISFKVLPDASQWVSHSWLFDVIAYMVFRVGDMAVVGLLVGFWLAGIGMAWKLVSRLMLRTQLFWPLLLTVSLVFGVFWKLHPLVVVPALLLWLYYLYVEWRSGVSRRLWLMVVALWLWAQLAGGFLFIGVGFLVVCLVLEVGYRLAHRVWRVHVPSIAFSIRPLLGWSVVGVIASLVNPSGVRLWVFLENLGYLSGANKIYSSLSGVLVAANSNYVRETISTYPFALYLCLTLVAVSVLVVLVIRQAWVGFEKLTIVLPLVPVLFLGYWWVRFIPISTFALLIVLVFGLHHILEVGTVKAGIGKGLLVVTGCMCVAVGLFFPPRKLAFLWPTESLKLVQELQLTGNVATTPDLSGYVYYQLYPKLGNIDVIDDLFDEYEAINVYSLVVAQKNEVYERFFRDQNVNMLLLNEDADYLIASASTSEEWQLVYFDQDGFVFVRKDLIDPEYLSEHGFSAVTFGRTLGFHPDQAELAISELQRFISRYPEAVLARGQLATIYRMQKRFEDAEKLLLEIPDDKWNFSVVVEMARLEAARGNCRTAERWYLLALQQRQETGVSKAVIDLAVLYAGCLKDMSKAEHFFKRYNSYPLPPDERERVRKIAKDFGVALDEADNDNK